MKINFLPFHIALCLTLGSSLLLSGTVQKARAGNLSDITGPIMTTSDGVGFGTRGRSREIVFRSNRIQAAINQLAALVNSQLQAGTFVFARGGSNIPLSTRVQQAIFTVLTGTGDVQASINQLATGLINPSQTKGEQKAQTENLAQVTDRTVLAQKLVSSLTGLTTKGKVNAAKLRASVVAYNAFVNASSGDYLSNPPEEFLAIQSVMSRLLQAAQTAA